ncbi:dCTP deaminase [Hyphomonas oceanitis]|uniref:Deoxycytidine triphosphate deaminase n=1 Tax=Hyphomonas oceanitis SCH89 TaxID=1280953 RepID=A0A059G7P0_9PROT|nr:2'-deoxycytidine 5'-triphosphate deaminase [Hyphomonas oceanitis]KDA02483.1 hypothetical protein HOC_10824 [Hyphomonas oceanitis SCH89]
MFLAASEITEHIATGRVIISPYQPDLVRGASVILTLGNRFRKWKRDDKPIDIFSKGAADPFLEDPFEACEFVLCPGDFVLASTAERVGLPHEIAGQLSALSHVARFGLSVVSGACFVGPGFGSSAPTALTLELVNHNPSPLRLFAGLPIAHLRLSRISGDIGLAPPSIYNGQDPLIAPAFYEEWQTRVRSKP